MSKWFNRLFAGNKTGADGAATAELTEVDPLAASVAQRKRGNEFLNQGELRKALACYREAVNLDSNSVDAYTSLGFVLKELGELEAAEEALGIAVQLKPDSFDAVYLVGQTFADLRQFEKAGEFFQRALDLKPDFEALFGELCHALFQTKDLNRAREVITRGIAL